MGNDDIDRRSMMCFSTVPASAATAELVRKSYRGKITGNVKVVAFYVQVTENFLNSFSGVGRHNQISHLLIRGTACVRQENHETFA